MNQQWVALPPHLLLLPRHLLPRRPPGLLSKVSESLCFGSSALLGKRKERMCSVKLWIASPSLCEYVCVLSVMSKLAFSFFILLNTVA